VWIGSEIRLKSLLQQESGFPNQSTLGGFELVR
jgi:hypothetical protein